jgi:hypothetical protein
MVNVLCDNALMLAYGEGVSSIGTAHIGEVARDLDLTDQQGRLRQGGAAAPVYRTGTNGTGLAGVTNDGKPAGPVPIAIPTLERYPSHEAGPSKLRRLANMLRPGNRT